MSGHSLIDKKVDGRYCVERKLGEGGQGEVYLAKDEHTGVLVVLKSPWAGMLLDDPRLKERFVRSVLGMGQLDHPNIVRVIDLVEHENRPVAVMPYLAGGDLAQRGELPLTSWLPKIADALDYLHQNRLVHRDVKPGNIFFNSRGESFLGDFGIVKSLDQDRITQTGVTLGTPSYMSPEAVEGKALDGRADQYSLATVVYERLCGQIPFDLDTPIAILHAHVTTQPTPISEIDGRFSVETTEVLNRALAKSPDLRFDSCTEFADIITNSLGMGALPIGETGTKERLALDRGRSGDEGPADAVSPPPKLQRRICLSG